MAEKQPVPSLLTQHLSEIKFHQVLQVRVNQQSLNKNFQIITKCLSKLNDFSVHMKTVEEELIHLKGRTAKSQTQIGTLNKNMELRKQFDLNQIIHCIEQHEEKITGLMGVTTKHRQDIDKLYDLAKYLDYNQVIKNIDHLQFFARSKETTEFEKQAKRKLEELEKQKMDADRCQKELRKCVQFTNYKPFYQDTNRELIRLEKEKMSHMQFSTQNEKTLVLQQRMGLIDVNFGRLSQQVEENNKFVLSIDLKDIQLKIKKAKQDLQYQINTIKPAVNSKISMSDLEEFQKQTAEKLQNFQQNAMQSLAEKSETKKALVFLQRRINQIIKTLNKNSDDPQKQEQLDAMLTKTNPFHCASCSTSLGKVSSRAGGFTNWSNFPLRDHFHEKDKNFENFIEKLALKRLSEPFLTKTNADEKLQQLADVLTSIKQKDSDDPTTTRTTNFMHGYGRSESKTSLKERTRLVSITEKKRPETRKLSQRNRGEDEF